MTDFKKISDIGEGEHVDKSMFRTPGTLLPGSVTENYFKLLSDLCSIRNDNMRKALANVLINGISRRDACDKYSVSQSYFCVKYQDMQRVSQLIVNMSSSIPRDE